MDIDVTRFLDLCITSGIIPISFRPSLLDANCGYSLLALRQNSVSEQTLSEYDDIIKFENDLVQN